MTRTTQGVTFRTAECVSISCHGSSSCLVFVRAGRSSLLQNRVVSRLEKFQRRKSSEFAFLFTLTNRPDSYEERNRQANINFLSPLFGKRNPKQAAAPREVPTEVKIVGKILEKNRITTGKKKKKKSTKDATQKLTTPRLSMSKSGNVQQSKRSLVFQLSVLSAFAMSHSLDEVLPTSQETIILAVVS